MRQIPFYLILLTVIMCSLIFPFGYHASSAYAETAANSKDPVSFLQESATSGGQANTSDSMNVFAVMLKVILYLIIIIGIFFIIIKALAQKNRRWYRGRTIKSIGGLMLAPNKSLQIVEVGHTLYLIGVGEDVRLIDKISDVEEVSFILETLSMNDHMDAEGWGTVGKWLKMVKNNGNETIISEGDTKSFHEIFREKMKLVSDRKKIIEDMLHEDNNKERPK